ncbi:glutaredoxin family protein [Falsibacillus pallidus]|uniref:Glutaredoxin-like YruB-family protein n=1 Tax=Falsibacillus pallidus TaxID=493781 RepID=A0A370GVD7_9BACI|nr:glutaredoxin family protein [Falsibacillus pallidus]RDI47642.1 glutaredoxin-like YruB-family protein [Falsibacillus pallidus]
MKEVIVYSQPECPPCEIVKLFLKEHSIPFKEKNIKIDSKAKKELINHYKAFSTPVTIIDGEAVIGFDLEKISSLLNIK